MSQTDHAPHLQALVQFYETLTPASLPRLGTLYTGDAFFKDPFNEVHRVEDIERIFAHMFEQLEAPRFLVGDRLLQGEQAFLSWEFRFRMKRWRRAPQCIRGASHLRFAPDGRLAYHRDYWDAAEELYAKLPLLGPLMRGLRRLAAAQTASPAARPAGRPPSPPRPG